MNPYTAKTQRCVVHRSRFDSWCNQEGVSSTLAAAKIVNNFNPQNVKVKSFAPRQIQRRLLAALVTLSRKVF